MKFCCNWLTTSAIPLMGCIDFAKPTQEGMASWVRGSSFSVALLAVLTC